MSGNGTQVKRAVVDADIAAGRALVQVAATYAALGAVDESQLPDGAMAFVQSNRSRWHLSKSSTLTADTKRVLNSLGSASGASPGRWLRDVEYADYGWIALTAWYIDAVGGNDETGTGAIGAPIKTWSEWFLRARGRYATTATQVNIANATGIDSMCYPLTYVGGDATITPSFVVRCTPTVAKTTSTLTTGYAAQSGNVGASVIDTGVADWSTYVGKILLITSGGSSGMASPIDVDLTGGKAQLAGPFNAVDGGSGNPATGASYQVVAPVAVVGALSVADGVTQVSYKWCSFGSASESVMLSTTGANFYGCAFTGSTINPGQYYSCVSTVALSPWENGDFEGYSCRWAGGIVDTFTGALHYWSKCIFRGTTGISATGGSYLDLQSCGFFGCTTAINAAKGCFVQMGGTIYGTGVATVFKLRSAATLNFSGAGSIAGSSKDYDLANGAQQIPKLTAGAAVPAASNCTTIAQLNAAPFNGYVVDGTDFARVVGD